MFWYVQIPFTYKNNFFVPLDSFDRSLTNTNALSFTLKKIKKVCFQGY